MNVSRAFIIVLLSLLLGHVALAQTNNQTPAQLDYPTPVPGDFVIRDFHFKSGETLPELKLHYTTIGAPVKDSAGIVRNAVLVMHGTGGSGRGFLNERFAGVLF